MKFAMTESHFPSYNYWYCAPRALPCWQRLKKGYFSTFFRRWGRENALRAAIARCGRRGRPIDVPGAGREAVGAARGRAGAERRKSSFSVALQPESNCT